MGILTLAAPRLATPLFAAIGSDVESTPTSTWVWLAFPLIGALIGWGTNWLAVKMIFRPHRPRYVLGIRLEGVIPRRRKELAQSVAETVERDLLSPEQIHDLVLSVVEGENVRALLHERIDKLIDEQVAKLGSIVQTFLPKDLVPKLKETLEAEVLQFLEGLSGEVRGEMSERLDIRAMVHERIEGFDVEQLEAIVLRIASKELRHIELLGAVLGGAIGVVQAGLVTLFG